MYLGALPAQPLAKMGTYEAATTCNENLKIANVEIVLECLSHQWSPLFETTGEPSQSIRQHWDQ